MGGFDWMLSAQEEAFAKKQVEDGLAQAREGEAQSRIAQLAKMRRQSDGVRSDATGPYGSATTRVDRGKPPSQTPQAPVSRTEMPRLKALAMVPMAR